MLSTRSTFPKYPFSENGKNAAFIPITAIFGSFTDEMSYKERILNVFISAVWRQTQRRLLNEGNEIFRRHHGKDFPPLDDLAKKTTLAFVNADEFFELPRPITHRIIYIGGIGVPKANKLSTVCFVSFLITFTEKSLALCTYNKEV